MEDLTAKDVFMVRWHMTQLFAGPLKGIRWMIRMYAQDIRDMSASYRHIMTH